MATIKTRDTRLINGQLFVARWEAGNELFLDGETGTYGQCDGDLSVLDKFVPYKDGDIERVEG